MLVKGEFFVQCRSRRGVILWHERIKNSATIEGLTYLLAAGFNSGTALTSWYVGLIDNNGFSEIDISDVMASHVGWAELTSYSQGTRPGWAPLAASGGLISNTANMVFTFSTGCTMAGLFVASDSTKGGTSGTLWATALFPLPKAVSNTQILELIYVVQGAGGT